MYLCSRGQGPGRRDAPETMGLRATTRQCNGSWLQRPQPRMTHAPTGGSAKLRQRLRTAHRGVMIRTVQRYLDAGQPAAMIDGADEALTPEQGTTFITESLAGVAADGPQRVRDRPTGQAQLPGPVANDRDSRRAARRDLLDDRPGRYGHPHRHGESAGCPGDPAAELTGFRPRGQNGQGGR